MKITLLTYLNLICLFGFSQQNPFIFDENSKLYLDRQTKLPYNAKYEMFDSLTLSKDEYYFSNGNLESTIKFFPDIREKQVRSIDLNTGVVKEVYFDSLNRQIYFKISGWNNYIEVLFDPVDGTPIIYYSRFESRASLEYLNEKGRIYKSYIFDLNKKKAYSFEGSTGFPGETFKTKYKSIKFLKDKSKLQFSEYNGYLQMGLYEVGPRFEYIEHYSSKTKVLQSIRYFKNGIMVKREVFKNNKLVLTENF